MFEFSPIMLWNLQATLVDLAIIFLLFISLKLLKGLVSNVHATDEIASRDNFAFGISFAGGIGALGIMLTGATTGEFGHSLLNEAVNMLSFGALGLLLITVGRIAQDKVALPQVNLHKEIVDGNVTAALVDVGNVLSVGVVVHAAMSWVETQGFGAMPIIAGAFIVSQLILMLVARYRVHLFKVKSGNQACMQEAMENHNSALGLRYAGFLIGASLAITAASGFITYTPDHVWMSVMYWGIAAIVITAIFSCIQLVAIKVLLPGVDISDEVDQQKNLGVAAIEAALSISIGLILVALLV